MYSVKAFVSGGHECNLLSTASCPPACTNAVLAAVKIMIVKEVYLVGVHHYCFRAGEPARVVGVKMITPIDNKGIVDIPQEPRVCYHIKFEDGQEDYVAKSDVEAGNWEFTTLDDMIRIGVPEVVN